MMMMIVLMMMIIIIITILIMMMMIVVTRPFYESRVNWVVDPAPPASRRPALEASSASTMPLSGDVPQPPRCQKSRRRKAAHPANQLPASRQDDVTAPAERTANDNSAHWRATRPRSAANDRPEMRSTQVEHPRSFTSSPCHSFPSQQPIKMQNAHLAGTTLKSGGFISQPRLTPDRIRLPPTQELTVQDLASPHLLYSNPPPNPSLDCLLGH